jgi:1,4-dihydroxy-2-naphthoyl-CoA hydrolase
MSDAPSIVDLGRVSGGPFVQGMGLVLDEVSATRVAGHLEAGADHHTPWGVVHGGLYASVIETVASVGASIAVHDRDQFAVGVNNQTDFLRPHRAGRLDVVAEPLQQGRTLQLWSVRITREDGKVVARGQLRLQNVPLER